MARFGSERKASKDKLAKNTRVRIPERKYPSLHKQNGGGECVSSSAWRHWGIWQFIKRGISTERNERRVMFVG